MTLTQGHFLLVRTVSSVFQYGSHPMKFKNLFNEESRTQRRFGGYEGSGFLADSLNNLNQKKMFNINDDRHQKL